MRVTGEALRQKILTEAIETVRNHGVEALTMRSLAEHLGYSPATLYLHFRSKEDLLGSVAEAGFADLMESLERILGRPGDPETQVRDAARVYLDFALGNPEMYRLMFDRAGLAAGHEQLYGRLRMWELACSVIQRGVDGGSFRALDSAQMALLTWTALHGFVELALSRGAPVASARLVDNLGPVREALIEERLSLMRAQNAGLR